MSQRENGYFYHKPTLDWIWSLPLTPDARVILLALAMHADAEGGSCYPAMRTLADLTRLRLGRVKQLIGALEAAELIDITVQGGPRSPNRYLLNVGAQLPNGFLDIAPQRGSGSPNSVRFGDAPDAGLCDAQPSHKSPELCDALAVTKDAGLCDAQPSHKSVPDAPLCDAQPSHNLPGYVTPYAERSVTLSRHAALRLAVTEQTNEQTNEQNIPIATAIGRGSAEPRHAAAKQDFCAANQPNAGSEPTTAEPHQEQATDPAANSGRRGERSGIDESKAERTGGKPKRRGKPKLNGAADSEPPHLVTHQMANFARKLGLTTLDVQERMDQEARELRLIWPPFVRELPAWRKRFFATCEAMAGGHGGPVQVALDEITHDGEAAQ